MEIDELAVQLFATLPPDAPRGTGRRAGVAVGGHRVEMTLSINRHGLRTLRWFCDGQRVSHATLLRLLCTESACPEARDVQLRWRAFRGLPPPPAPRRAAAKPAGAPVPLAVEQPIEAAGHRCVLRAATFPCQTPCPRHAHEPMALPKPGWDLFEDGVCIGGGTRTDPATGATVPRFATPDDARRWLLDHQALALRAMPAGPHGQAR